VGLTMKSKPSHFAVFGRWLGPHRRFKTLAFRGVWAVVVGPSRPSRFAVFGHWWLHRRVKTFAFRCVWALADRRVKTLAFLSVWALVIGRWWASPLRLHHRVSRRLGAGGPHRRVKTIAFRGAWALVGLTAASKPLRFAVFGRWWVSPPDQNHRVSQCLGAGGCHARLKQSRFAYLGTGGFTAGSKPSRFEMFGRWWASPLGQNHRVSRCLGAGELHRRLKTIAFCTVWVLAGFTAGSKPYRFVVFGCWWASRLG
jgi:hypothetical protein